VSVCVRFERSLVFPSIISRAVVLIEEFDRRTRPSTYPIKGAMLCLIQTCRSPYGRNYTCQCVACVYNQAHEAQVEGHRSNRGSTCASRVCTYYFYLGPLMPIQLLSSKGVHSVQPTTHKEQSEIHWRTENRCRTCAGVVEGCGET